MIKSPNGEKWLRVRLKNGTALLSSVQFELGHAWIHTSIDPPPELDPVLGGRWIVAGIQSAAALCIATVLNGKVGEDKHMILKTPGETTICCFYVDAYDTAGHRKLLDYLIHECDVIPRRKDGSLSNISFKYNHPIDQIADPELVKEAREAFPETTIQPPLHLSDFYDLKTGEWNHHD